VFAWYHATQVVARQRTLISQRFHKKISLYTPLSTEVALKRRIFLLLLITLLAAAGLHAAPAPAQSLLTGLAIDGIRCDISEGAVEHIHTHLQLFNHGHQVSVPAQIGIPAGAGCLYWVHTHADDGIIHIEAPVAHTFTLGEFFDIWDAPLSRTQAASVIAGKRRALRVTVNGHLWTRDPRSVPLRDHEEVVIQAGPPYVAGHRADWSKL
jgi:hypothetical protein